MTADTSGAVATLGDRIKECRRAQGWRLDDLAKKSGVSKGFLSDLENNQQKNPGINYLRTIAGALGVDLHFLITGHGAHSADAVVEVPRSLLELAKDEQLSMAHTMMLLDASRHIVSHRDSDAQGDDLRTFPWRAFYQALKPFLRA